MGGVLSAYSSKKSDQEWKGRNSQNKMVVFPKAGLLYKKGDYAWVNVKDNTQGTLLGEIIEL
ncbi:MAG: TRAM domain-containing protein [Pedobacter sp.]|nr:MAG: TRAM domain-containing protein [Pedobacter sp.]